MKTDARAEKYRLQLAVSLFAQGHSLEIVTAAMRKWGAVQNEIETLAQSQHIAQSAKLRLKLALPEILPTPGPDDWKKEFTPLTEWELPDTVEIVQDMIIEGGITCFAGLFESYKSMAAFELSAAILQERPAFDYFTVYRHCEILFLCPDMPPGLFKKYASCFGLHNDPQFRAISPVSDIFAGIDHPSLQAAVRGRILILDTMLDYARIKDAFRSDEWVVFFQKLRELIRVYGCIAIVLITHPTKAGARNSEIDPTEFLKDSVTFGGKLDIGFAFRKPDRKLGKLFVERIKGRPFEGKSLTFTVASHDDNGQSYISRGRFPIYDKPEAAGELRDHLQNNRSGRKSNLTPEIHEQIDGFLRTATPQREIAARLGLSLATAQRYIEKVKANGHYEF